MMPLEKMAVELARLPGALTWAPHDLPDIVRRHYGENLSASGAFTLCVAIRAVLRERGVLR